MKQIRTTYHNNEQEVLGLITLKPKRFPKRLPYILVTDDVGKMSGKYQFLITSGKVDGNALQYCTVDDLSGFNEGDVVSIDTCGNISFLYERRSSFNIVFATSRCNHRCVMCPQPPVVQERDRTDYNMGLIKLFNKDTREIGITGGEPTMIGDKLFDLIKQIKKSCPKAAVSILSNGVKFADIDYASKLAACNHRDMQIDVPIFSDIAAEHNRIVGAKTFYRTVQGLYNLAQFGLRIGLRVVVHKQTYKRLPQLAEFIYHNFPFVAQVAFMQMETTGLAAENLLDLWIDPYDYNNELRESVCLLNDRGITAYVYNAQLCVLPEELRPFAKQSISDWKDVYLPVCEGCCLRGECAGFFSTNAKNISTHIHKMECADNIIV